MHAQPKTLRRRNLPLLALIEACAVSAPDGHAQASTTGTDGGDGSGASDSTEAGSGDSAMFVPDPTWERWSLRFPSYALASESTIYACAGASFASDGPVHVVAFDPVIDEASAVHHMVLAVTTEPALLVEPCYPAPADATMQWGWAPGAGAFELPEQAGFRVGDGPGLVHYVLQIHYDNALGRDDLVDESGVDIYVTRELRLEDAGVLVLGDVAGLVIPAGWSDWHTAHVCSADSTRELMRGPAHVFGSWLHAHTLATALWTEHARDGARIGLLGEINPYRFDDQRLAQIDAIVEPGDQLATHCVYDSTSRTEPTYGGGSTTDEMCLNYLLYHPQQPFLSYCNDP